MLIKARVSARELICPGPLLLVFLTELLSGPLYGFTELRPRTPQPTAREKERKETFLFYSLRFSDKLN